MEVWQNNLFPATILYVMLLRNKKVRFFVYFMYIFECIASMMTGGRTEGILPLLVLIAYYFQYGNKKKEIFFYKVCYLNYFNDYNSFSNSNYCKAP
ncbi:O-antigen polysaccharide polymerase Wzy [Limosilactobacillus fermentum]